MGQDATSGKAYGKYQPVKHPDALMEENRSESVR